MRSGDILQQRSTLALGLALIALIAIDITAFRTAIRYGESVEVVNRSYRVLATLSGTMANLVSAESEVRGYTITANDQFLVLYGTAVRDARQGLLELERSITDPVSKVYLGRFNELCEARLERLEITLETRQTAGFEAVRRATGPGKALMDESREVAAQIEIRQRQLLAERDKLALVLSKRTVIVVLVGSGFAVALHLASMLLLAHQMSRRVRLEREVLEISEREQRRIGQDLHDGLCQQLTGISLLGRSLHQKLSGESAGEVDTITRLINESIEQTRQVTRGLLPVPDEVMGLMLALRELADGVNRTGGIVCNFHCPAPVPVPDRAAATNLYRIAQEATQNALRHASAALIEISLTRSGEEIVLKVTDDGIGLIRDPSSGGLGLEIMAYRARAIGGSLEARRGDAGGTVVCCQLPVSSLT
jgi:signal transduction histidine kinase